MKIMHLFNVCLLMEVFYSTNSPQDLRQPILHNVIALYYFNYATYSLLILLVIPVLYNIPRVFT